MCFSTENKDPLDGVKASVWNFVLLSLPTLEPELELDVEVVVEVEVELDLECGFGSDKFKSRVEKLADTALGTAGQRVSSVSGVIWWNFA